VAAEPVDFVFPPMPPAIVMHDKLGPLFDRLSMHFYAYKCMTSAAPQQPAQSAEQDERAASPTDDEIIEDATEAFGRSREYSNCFGEPSERSLVHFVRKYMARAASTQSTATQPVQTQVALTDEQVMSVSIINGEVTDYKYAGNLLDGEYPLYVVRHLTEGQAASILAAALRFETEGNKPMANDLRALLAAQPVSGADHD
jgi:hypothetical protein